MRIIYDDRVDYQQQQRRFPSHRRRPVEHEPHLAVALARSSPAIPNVQHTRHGIVGFRIRAEGEFHGGEQLQVAPAIHSHVAPQAVRREELPEARRVVFALRLVHPGQAPQPPIGLEIHHLEGMVAQGSDEKPLAPNIHTEMVDATGDVWQGDGCDQLQRPGSPHRQSGRRLEPEREDRQCVHDE